MMVERREEFEASEAAKERESFAIAGSGKAVVSAGRKEELPKLIPNDAGLPGQVAQEGQDSFPVVALIREEEEKEEGEESMKGDKAAYQEEEM